MKEKLNEEEVWTIAEYAELPIGLQLTILYEDLNCTIDPKLDLILDLIYTKILDEEE